MNNSIFHAVEMYHCEREILMATGNLKVGHRPQQTNQYKILFKCISLSILKKKKLIGCMLADHIPLKIWKFVIDRKRELFP